MNKVIKYKFLLIALFITWNVTEVIGAAEIYNSRQFNNYINVQLGHLKNPMPGFLANIPEVNCIFTAVFSVIILMFYWGTISILNNKKPITAAKYVIIIIWGAVTTILIKNIFNCILLMLKWKFYFSVIPKMLIVIIFITMVGKLLVEVKSNVKAK